MIKKKNLFPNPLSVKGFVRRSIRFHNIAVLSLCDSSNSFSSNKYSSGRISLWLHVLSSPRYEGHQLFAYQLFGHLVAVVGIPAAGQEAVHINHSAEDAADGKIPVGHVRLISLVHFPAGNENKISPGGREKEFHVGNDA